MKLSAVVIPFFIRYFPNISPIWDNSTIICTIPIIIRVITFIYHLSPTIKNTNTKIIRIKSICEYPSEYVIMFISVWRKAIWNIIDELDLHLEVENSLGGFYETSCDAVQKINNYLWLCEKETSQ